MALKRRSEQQSSSNVEYSNLPEGEHEGRLVYVADLGLQKRDYMGDEKPPAQQISLGIEIVGESVTIDGEERPRLLWTRPFYIYGAMSERGKEYQFYKVFDPTAKEGEYADWDGVLNVPCNVIVKHMPNKQNPEQVYDNIDTITPIPKKYQSGVDEARLTDMCVGDADNPENPAQKATFGLAAYALGNRIMEEDVNTEKPKENTSKPEPVAQDDMEDEIPW